MKLDGNELPCENALRVLSWNMDSLSVEKARNPGIVHVLVELLLRYHIRVAVIQGIQEPLALQTVITLTSSIVSIDKVATINKMKDFPFFFSF